MSDVLNPNGVVTSGQSPYQFDDFGPSEDGVEVVRQFLLNFIQPSTLPPELVDEIIDLAQYWPRVRTHCEVPTRVGNGELCCYLVTPPISAETSRPLRHRRVREIRFKVRSHDQGWGGEYGHQGTYNGSWTWFEAVILPPPAMLGNPKWYQEVLTGPTRLKSNVLQTVSLVQDGQPRRWFIQCNVTASGMTREHTVTWTIDGTDHEEQRYDQFKGRVDRGHEAVRLLKPGDRLAMIAKALFPGWVNHVISASAEIIYYLR
ncbi:hypothetical protein K435DRAFT_836588 [Dendrothele bispora CBS 962.96]|uniref:Uncharacterized protein n=1 Tax=Dendrothele bispora (strain CBS 962.96) TaxID=1314807 RepID=A0A4S8MHU1_DENBC|nr:hypothetical protein K435DRAFT_836588 [Dendrothele bispora CBS 962.96]